MSLVRLSGVSSPAWAAIQKCQKSGWVSTPRSSPSFVSTYGPDQRHMAHGGKAFRLAEKPRNRLSGATCYWAAQGYTRGLMQCCVLSVTDVHQTLRPMRHGP